MADLTPKEQGELRYARDVDYVYHTVLIRHQGAPRHQRALATIRRLEGKLAEPEPQPEPTPDGTP